MEHIKGKMKSLYISLLLYFSFGLLASQLVYSGLNSYVNERILDLMNPRPASVFYKNDTQIVVYRDEETDATPAISDQKQFHTLRIVTKVLPVFTYGLGILLTAYVFYVRKLKLRFALLRSGIEEISRNNLDFSVECKGNDEITALCSSFEIMRRDLKMTIESLCEEEERQSNLYRAFAHDLRTPLTVLKGNTDVIRYLIAKDEVNKEEILEILDISNEALGRIELYTDALKELKDVEQWDNNAREIEVGQIVQLVRKQYVPLAKERGKELVVQCKSGGSCRIDMMWLQLILDKILENAVRFAEQTITVQMENEAGRFLVEVLDDGAGFNKEAIQKATDMFYSTDKARGHTGIGLSVVEKLLSRMNSSLRIENLEKGAKVSFCIENV